ncbi:UNVERIFIED_CONTAM: hypothetical protein RMT77_013147 [Armadillidium vulgare]
MSSFLSLLKEEPTEGTDMDSSNGHMTMPRPMVPPVVSEPQLQGLPISPLTPGAMQPTPVIMRDIDPNFEPVSRGRSNTWPLLPEGFMESDESSVVDPTSSGEAQRLGGGASSLLETPGGPPKKNTSRRNPWGNMSYADLIAQAIASSPEGRATLSQIYDWMVQNVPYFKDKGDSNSSAGWKNSIRHNLSLHNRFMRMQNEGTGKSSWWVLNPDAKPGKSTRRRANTLEGGNRMEKKRGRVRKKEGMRNSIEAPPSPNIGDGMEYFPGSPAAASLHHPFQLSPQDYRPRASSNASSCGRLSPIPSVEADMHDSQVPPVSPSPGWPDYWPGPNHVMSHHMGRHLPEPYTEHLVESIGEGLKLGTRDSWGPHHGLGPHTGSSDCLKTASHPHHHHHPMNGFLTQPHNQHPPGYGGYDDYSTYMPPNSQCGGSTFPHNQNLHHPPKEKLSMRRHIRSFPVPPNLQIPSSHNVSLPMGEPQFPPSLEQDASLTPPFSNSSTVSCNNSNNITCSTNRLTPSSSSNRDGIKEEPSSTAIPTTSVTGSVPILSSQNPANHHNQQPCESTTMLRVALSHRDASSYSVNGVSHYRHNGSGLASSQPHSSGGSNDLVDLDNIQGGLECNVDEVIKHELQYDDQLTFDFQQQQQQGPPYAHSHSYPHRDGAGPQIGGPPGSVQVYNSYSSIPNGNNQWVR